MKLYALRPLLLFTILAGACSGPAQLDSETGDRVTTTEGSASSGGEAAASGASASSSSGAVETPLGITIPRANLGIGGAIALSEDGRISVNGTFVGTLGADGSFTDLQNQRLFEVDESGRIHAPGGYEVVQRVRPDGVLVQPDGQEVRINDEGNIERGGEQLATVRGYAPGLARTTFLAMLYATLGNAILAHAP